MRIGGAIKKSGELGRESVLIARPQIFRLCNGQVPQRLSIAHFVCCSKVINALRQPSPIDLASVHVYVYHRPRRQQ
jgi:hypothetical protein